MSDTAARAALERMNLREVAVAPMFSTLAADLQRMAQTSPEEAAQKFLDVTRNELCEAYGYTGVKQEKPFAFANGIAIIPVTGSLINRFGASYGGFVTGYNFIRRQLALAQADDDVKTIVGDFNSYGGEAAGCFELSDEIFEMRGNKPMVAVVDSNAYSAGYALASAFDKVVLTPSGGVGSIGVVAMHMDLSKLLADFGVKITFIHFGEHKIDGNPYEVLPADVKKDIQKSVDASGEKFVALVARNRNIDAKVVRDTQARTYRADDALSLGLIDTIATPSKALLVLSDELTGSVTNPETEDSMSTEAKPGTQDQAAIEAAQATALAQATAKATADAKTAERARVAGIQGCEEAKGRSTLANHLAMQTDMSVDEAKAILKASPAAAEAAPAAAVAAANPFKAAMDAGQHPNVGADGGNEGATLTPEQKASAILNDFKAAGGMMPVAAAK